MPKGEHLRKKPPSLDPRNTGGLRANAGRKVGSLAAKRPSVQEFLEGLHIKPFEGMLRVATLAEMTGDLPTAGRMYQSLAKYVAPELRAVEVSGGIDVTIDFAAELYRLQEAATRARSSD